MISDKKKTLCETKPSPNEIAKQAGVLTSETQGQIVGTRKSLNGRKEK